MSKFTIEKGGLEGLLIIHIKEATDHKDYLTYNKNLLQQLGFNVDFVQENQSLSHQGVIRGVHLQKEYPQGKLIRVASGSIFDVAVDLRKDSKTYKKWYGIELSGENRKQFYIPSGFAHGFMSLENDTVVVFKVTDYFHPGDEIGFRWDDPDIQIKWPVLKKEVQNKSCYTTLSGKPIIIGEKDVSLPYAKEVLDI
ncbi:MAG: dTDP-4-dehydrorhamnose 3,5-epimerase [Anaerostipes sp.]|jgi:dTDP-4-dehydrorhamnose 3,5-epimerase